MFYLITILNIFSAYLYSFAPTTILLHLLNDND